MPRKDKRRFEVKYEVKPLLGQDKTKKQKTLSEYSSENKPVKKEASKYL